MSDELEEAQDERLPEITDGASALPIMDGWLVFPEGAKVFCQSIGAQALHVTEDGDVWACKDGRWQEMPTGPVADVSQLPGSRRVQ